MTNSQRNARKGLSGEWIGAVSNLSIQYNLGSIAPALLLLDPSRALGSEKSSYSIYPRSDETDSLLKGAVFVGAIVGQCTMGFVGDLTGSLEAAMLLTNALALIGTVGCTLAPTFGANNPDTVYSILAVSRAVLGIGVGGKYPLASAMRAEIAEAVKLNADGDEADYRAKEVARSFFWQTPGAILPYVFSAILLWLMGEPSESHATNIKTQYMILVGVGAIPSLAVLLAVARRLQQNQSWTDSCGEGEALDAGGRYCCLSVGERRGYRRIHHNKNPVFIAIQNRACWKKLAGTGLCWALYDFIYYGTAFNLPEIFSRVLGGGDDLLTDAWHNALIASMGIPGVLLAIRMMEPIGGPNPLQLWGFVSIGVASMLVAVSYASSNAGRFQTYMAIAACSLLIFTLNWGCNVSSYKTKHVWECGDGYFHRIDLTRRPRTFFVPQVSTYVLPIEVFPATVRSTFHGWSAGMGKCGAALGSFLFTKMNSVSVALTFNVCIGCCVVGVLITHYFIDDIVGGKSSASRLSVSKESGLEDETELTGMLNERSPPLAEPS
jgi:MFS family permease